MTSLTIVSQNQDLNGWERTDDFQFSKKVGENTFHIIEITELPNKTCAVSSMVIDLDDYIFEEGFFEEYLVSYGYSSIDDIKSKYGTEEWKQIAAECISETDSYREGNLKHCNSIEDVEKYLESKYGLNVSLK